MANDTIAILHPGEMGAAIGARLRAKDLRVIWAGAGRSAATRARAAAAGLADAGTLRDVLAASDLVLSVCPSHAAVALAREVAAEGYRGIYVDANAIAPATASEVARIVAAHRAARVQGAVQGGMICEAQIAAEPDQGGRASHGGGSRRGVVPRRTRQASGAVAQRARRPV